MQQTADINGAPHRSRGYAIDIDALLHFAVELTPISQLIDFIEPAIAGSPLANKSFHKIALAKVKPHITTLPTRFSPLNLRAGGYAKGS